MFKLIKIENSGTNQPEPIRVPAFYDIGYESGDAYCIRNNVLIPIDDVLVPSHICLETLDYNEKRTVLCFKINENMIFETTSFTDGATYNIGEKYDVADGIVGQCTGIKNTQNRPLLIVERQANNVKKGDPVLVRFLSRRN